MSEKELLSFISQTNQRTFTFIDLDSWRRKKRLPELTSTEKLIFISQVKYFHYLDIAYIKGKNKYYYLFKYKNYKELKDEKVIPFYLKKSGNNFCYQVSS
ncbi:hypothetical protein B835_1958 [Enterococcus mundtii 3F]|uniref:Uncharacterized protein n=1 Tax=Enterococcus faecium TaxID=1352 RepID=A0A0D5MBK7_ENTFC|nr:MULTISPECIES: hypothetical protein [Enterococcus]AJY53561.1 hypothetical protein pEfm12493_077 [Enterococcus faecium]MDA9462031.1 hypothetical protein [Enterococcus mundtii 3F]